MKEMPAVSVIMPVYNTKIEFLKEAVQSIIHQNFDDFELAIVDNGSSDKDVREFLNSQKDQRVQVLTLSQNIGPAKARNYAIKNSNGKHIAFMDSDDVALPSRLKEEFEYLEYHPATALVCSRTKVLSKEPFDQFKNFSSDR
ncbi:MAG TPA: hypothetical protein DCL74_04865, partial [Succinivibrionaceae bacterium]|nr:hypothetical protein [Succinivibrionaceae bacterium]